MTFTKVDKQSLRDRAKGFPFDEDPSLWETFFVYRTASAHQIFGGYPAIGRTLGVYFQPKAGTGGPVTLLEEIEEIWEVSL